MFLFFWSDVVCAYCLFAEQVWSLFWHRPCFVVFFSLFFFFFVEELVFFFFSGSFFFFPYKSLCSISEIIRSPSDLCSSLCSFISSRFDHNVIPVYKPKFTRKAETKRNRPNLKNRSRFSKQYDPTTVRMGLCFFSHWVVLEAKKPQNWEVRDFSNWTIRSGSGFKTLFFWSLVKK